MADDGDDAWGTEDEVVLFVLFVFPAKARCLACRFVSVGCGPFTFLEHSPT